MLTRLYSYTLPIRSDVVDAFCALAQGFTDQFVFYDKAHPTRYLGLGRCVAVGSLGEVEYDAQGPQAMPPALFTFSRFDAGNPAPTDELFASFPSVGLMVPEVVLIEDEAGAHLQLNSLGPVYRPRVERFVRACEMAPARTRVTIPFVLGPSDPGQTEADARAAWSNQVERALGAIGEGRVGKVVLSRRQRVAAQAPFTSIELLVNLIDGPARGCVLLYRYADVFFCGCTPELLVRKRGESVESMCLAGTCPTSDDEQTRVRLADELLRDEKNLREHAFVVNFVRQVFERACYDVRIPDQPDVMVLPNVQHLHTPARARLIGGRTLLDLAAQLDPTPALSGAPVGEALMLIRQIEPYARGLYGGAAGFVRADGDGELRVALRTGVFDGRCGYVYAGCGIVAGSNADSEYDETGMKMRAVLSAFDGGAGAEVRHG